MSIDWNPLRDYSASGDVVTDEVFTVPAAPHEIYPEFTPQKNTPTSIEIWTGSGKTGTQYSEKAQKTDVSASGDFYAHYDRGGYLTFHSSAEGLGVYMNYNEIGTFTRAKHMNSIKDVVGSGDLLDRGGNNNLVSHGNDDDIHMKLDTLGDPPYEDVQDWFAVTQSAGPFNGLALTSGDAGTINIAAGDVILKQTDSNIGVNEFYHYGGMDNLPLTDQSTNWIYLDRKDGAPSGDAIVDWSGLNLHTQAILGKVYRDGDTVHIVETCQCIDDFSRKLMQMQYEVVGAARAAGMVISTSNQYIATTAGGIWEAVTRHTIDALDTDPGQLATKFSAWYVTNGVWTEVTGESEFSNTEYNDITTGLETLLANRYAVHWVYIGHDNHLQVQYGQGNYTLAQAQAALVPTPPTLLGEFAILVGKIIIKKSAASATSTESAFTKLFVGAAPSDHAGLANLSYASAGHTGFASAAANIGDNLLVRGDGAATGIQKSGITVDDSDNVSGIVSVVISAADHARPNLDVLRVLNLEATAGESKGIYVQAGSTGADYAQRWYAYDGTTHIAVLRGDGSFTIGPSTSLSGLEFELNRATAPSMALRRVDTSISDGNGLGFIKWYGDDPEASHVTASIRCYADGTWDTDDYPSRLEFYTTLDGAAAPTLQMTIDNAGSVFLPQVYDDDLNGETYRDLLIKNDGQLGYDSSSATKKTNIRRLEDDDISWLWNLRPVMYDRLTGTARDMCGFIAEEVDAIQTKLVSYKRTKTVVGQTEQGDNIYKYGEDTGVPETVNVGNAYMVAALTKALQTQRAEIADLTARLKKVEEA